MRKDLKLEKFEEFKKNLIKRKKSFKIVETKYTKRIKMLNSNNIYLFSDEPTEAETLQLINMIRKDAKAFRERTKFEKSVQSYDIDFFKFVDKGEEIDKIKGFKIDINQAYWRTALNIGLLSAKTQIYLDGLKNRFSKSQLKKIRLKSLGSLATKKIESVYINGVENVKELNEFEQMEFEHKKFLESQNRSIYLYICEIVADTMQTLVVEFFDSVIYYYWDCIFIKEKTNLDLLFKRINEIGYKCKIEGEGFFTMEKRKKTNAIIFEPNSNSKTKEIKKYNVNEADFIY